MCGGKGSAAAMLLGVLSMLGGCATVTTGSNQSVTLDTDPQGATCKVRRGEEQVAVVNPTPGTILIDKGFGALAVQCTKQGFQDASGTLTPAMHPMTFGNILIGGLIGIAIDAASGAMMKYPTFASYRMFRATFSSEAERDAYFEEARSRLAKEAVAAEATLRKQCPTESDCESYVSEARKAANSALAEIEAKRLAARIDPKATAAAAVEPVAPPPQEARPSENK